MTPMWKTIIQNRKFTAGKLHAKGIKMRSSSMEKGVSTALIKHPPL
jgi:hypothetical protein